MPKHYRYPIEMKELTKLRNVHPEAACGDEVCVIHNPTDHHMRQMPLHWRNDRRIMERICEHGVGHPDPDHLPRWQASGWGYLATHGCCWGRCCDPALRPSPLLTQE